MRLNRERHLTLAWLVVLTAVALALGGCGGETTGEKSDISVDGMPDQADLGETGPETDGGPGELAETTPWEVEELKDQVEGEATPELIDGTGETDLPEECTGPGEFMCPCKGPKDCLSGYCVEWKDGMVCSKECIEDCPNEGWVCIQDMGALPDYKYICVAENIFLCRPCMSNDECKHAFAETNDTCVSQGDAGNFCGVDCSLTGKCPTGYACAEVQAVTGAKATQCVPKGECKCTAKFVQDGAWTECVRANGYGVCQGKRQCTDQGLTECSAVTPKPEECNGIDDNCDDDVDPLNSLKCITYYFDQDGDGYGIGAGDCACKKPGNKYVTLGGDCDDSNVGINPDIKEGCNFLDDDCDGQTDESFSDGCEIMYHDADHDGIGNEAETDCLCKETKDYKKVAGDCDDNNPAAYPGAAELCDSIDNNCDTVIDEENAEGCTPYYLDQDGDGYGLSDQLKCLCAKIGDYKAIKGGDCDDTVETGYNIHPTVVELCDGLDNDCDASVDEDEAVLSCGTVAHGQVGCQAGCVVTSCEDGYFDLNTAFIDGCECEREATEVADQLCGDTSTFMGDLPDSSSATSTTGRIVPAGDEDWYKFNAIDGLDVEGCDTFHVRVRFLKNPNDAYAFDVYKGGCAGADNICGGVDLFEFFTDFHNDVGPPEIPGGECKCKPDPDHSITAEDTADDTDPTTHACTDQSSVYYVRVYRLPGAVVACDDYQIEFSNGIAVQ